MVYKRITKIYVESNNPEELIKELKEKGIKITEYNRGLNLGVAKIEQDETTYVVWITSKKSNEGLKSIYKRGATIIEEERFKRSRDNLGELIKRTSE